MSKKILYIEDNPLNIRLANKILRVMGYNVTTALDGEAGIELALKDCPDIILLDINLPDMDGFEVLQHLRKNPSLKQVPVVAFTADTMNHAECREAGFDAYLNKPVSRTNLLRTVQQFLVAQT